MVSSRKRDFPRFRDDAASKTAVAIQGELRRESSTNLPLDKHLERQDQKGVKGVKGDFLALRHCCATTFL
jgi:hypothetical protein